MASIRTQIYLSPELRAQLDDVVRRENRAMAEIVREALGMYLSMRWPDAEEALSSTFGTIPSLSVPPREEWDRG